MITQRKKFEKPESAWKAELTGEQYRVCREKGTESPFTGEFFACKEEGTYCCVCCGNPLFSSMEKFDSGSGWPSFWKPKSRDCVRCESDTSHGMARIEVRCNYCDAHLGHVFDDGPDPTGKRYCINSISLSLDRIDKEG